MARGSRVVARSISLMAMEQTQGLGFAAGDCRRSVILGLVATSRPSAPRVGAARRSGQLPTAGAIDRCRQGIRAGRRGHGDPLEGAADGLSAAAVSDRSGAACRRQRATARARGCVFSSGAWRGNDPPDGRDGEAVGVIEGRVVIAAAIVALDPVLAAPDGLVMTEPLAAFLVAATLAAVADGSRRGAALGGIGCGLAALTRPSLLPFAGLAALAGAIGPPGRATRAAASRRTSSGSRRRRRSSPWAWRNSRVFGEPIVTTTHGGYTLALANNPIYYDEVLNGPPGAVWSGRAQFDWFAKVNTEMAGLSEPEADRRLRESAVRLAMERPRRLRAGVAGTSGPVLGRRPQREPFIPLGSRSGSAVWTVPLWIALRVGLVSPPLWRWPRILAASGDRCRSRSSTPRTGPT